MKLGGVWGRESGRGRVVRSGRRKAVREVRNEGRREGLDSWSWKRDWRRRRNLSIPTFKLVSIFLLLGFSLFFSARVLGPCLMGGFW